MKDEQQESPQTDETEDLLDALELDAETFATLDLHNPRMLVGVIEEVYGKGAIQTFPAQSEENDDVNILLKYRRTTCRSGHKMRQ